ncbi:amino acid adenylation domain-containing protein [Streptomyces sp. NPDC056921]|uniref:non-ribosomal peptide synthetase n=1 Tax=Streptomyces sp. NPDC056921 TaxID=3345966 RepID=UPI0036369C0F
MLDKNFSVPEGERDLEFWRRTLAGLPSVELPLDRRREVPRGQDHGSVRVSIDAETTSGLLALCNELGTTPFTAMVASVRVLLFRLCRSEDVPLGTLVADAEGREPANAVVLRTELAPERGFRDLVAAVARSADDAHAHRHYPFATLVEELAAGQAAGRHPVFDVLVLPAGSGPAADLPASGPAHSCDLVFEITAPGTSGRVDVLITYRPDVLDHSSVGRFAEQLRFLVGQMISAPEVPILSLPSLPPEQRAELLALGSGGTADFPAGRNLLDLVEAQIARRPDAEAVICGDRTLTFAELDRAASVLAARLAEGAPTGQDRVVAFVCARSGLMVVMLLAILRSGSAFLPMDPEQPPHRLGRLVRDSAATAVLVDTALGSALTDALAEGGTPVMPVSLDSVRGMEEEPAAPKFRPAVPGDLAYVVYTSGSTGAPKGVMVEHRGILNTVRFRMGYYGLGPDSRVLQVDPIHADAGIADVFTALASATPLVVITREQLLDPDEVAAVIRRERITHALMVPSLYQLLLDYAGSSLGSVRQVVLGGERVTDALAARHAELLPRSVLYNEYGPSEDSVLSTLHRLAPGHAEVPIGRPLPDRWVDLLDERGELVPLGAPGELCIGGVGLARGYRGDTELTARRFVTSPVRGGERMYRTGDLARWLPDGSLFYLGRIDDQVKIRGNRVEPGEVAAVLSEAPGVRGTAVVAIPGTSGEPRLVAYVVGDAEHGALHAFLAGRLPAFMLPEEFLSISSLPLSPNGKLDRKALPAPRDSPRRPESEEAGPLTVAEQRIARLWSELLQQPVTSPDAGLFESGGHSLAAARIAQELGIPVSTVFANQTVRSLARVAGDTWPTAPAHRSVPPDRAVGATPLSRAQRRVWLSSRRDSADVFIISDLLRTGRTIDADALRAALTAVVERQEMLRAYIRPAGNSADLVVLDGLADGVPLRVIRLPGADPDGPDVADALHDAREISFDLERAPLFEIRLLQGPVGGDLLTVTAHHLVYDGASVDVLLGDLFTAYERAVAGESPALSALTYSFRDWTEEEREWLDSAQAGQQESFWRKRLAGVVKTPDLVDPARRGARRGTAGLVRRSLPAEVLGTAAGTPFAVVVTAFTAMVHRATQACDLVLGFPASLRQHTDADALVGYLANAVPLRLEYDPGDDLAALLGHVQDRIVEAYEYSRLPFDVLAERLALTARPGRSVLLDLGVSWENATIGPESYLIEDVLPDHLPASSDLWLYASRRGDRLRLDLTYDDRLVTAEEAEAFSDQLASLVSDTATRPRTPIGSGAPGARTDTGLAAKEQSWSSTRYDF